MNQITKWATMTTEERKVAFGDPNDERNAKREEYDRDCALRFQQGLPLSIDGRRKARDYLKRTKSTDTPR